MPRQQREQQPEGPAEAISSCKASAVRSPRMMRPFKGVRKAQTLFFPAVALAGSAVLSGGIFANFERHPAEQAVAGRPRQIADEGFATSGTCRACHPSQYASWHASYHRTMTQLATPVTVLTSFDGVTVEVEREALAERNTMRLERDAQ